MTFRIKEKEESSLIKSINATSHGLWGSDSLFGHSKEDQAHKITLVLSGKLAQLFASANIPNEDFLDLGTSELSGIAF